MDFLSQMSLVEAIPAQNSVATIVGTVIDTQGYEGCIFLGMSGTLTAGGFDILIEDALTSGGTYAAVADAFIIPNAVGGQEALRSWASGESNETRKIGVFGARQFLRMTLTETGALSEGGICVIAALVKAHLLPALVDTVKT